MKNDRTNKKKRRSTCKDCGCRVGISFRMRPIGINVMYMLKDALWLKVNDGERRGHLCLVCAQVRLGRKFIPADFRYVPLNFRHRGALELLFPQEYADHQRSFVSDEDEEVVTVEVSDDGRTAKEAPKRKRGRPKGSKTKKSKRKQGRPSTHSVKTRKGMAARRKAGKAITGSIYGYNKGKDGTISPNWREQLNIEWMYSRVNARKNSDYRLTASQVAKILNANGYKGKKGGSWTSTGVLRTIRRVDHVERQKTLTQYPAPKYFAAIMAKIKAKHQNPLGFKELTELL